MIDSNLITMSIIGVNIKDQSEPELDDNEIRFNKEYQVEIEMAPKVASKLWETIEMKNNVTGNNNIPRSRCTIF